VNQWGYRGPIQSAPHPGVRVALVGGSAAFSAATPWAETVAARIPALVNERRKWTTPGGPFASVDNLAEPGAGPDSYIVTLADYDYLHPDIICIYADGDAGPTQMGRRTSVTFRAAGYLPAMFVPRADERAAPPLAVNASNSSCAAGSASYCTAIADTVRYALQRGKRALVAAPPPRSAWHQLRQRSLGDTLRREFGREPRFRYVDLGSTIDRLGPAQSEDGVEPASAPPSARSIAERLAEAIDSLIAPL
jgi:hypothetical protein